MFLIDRTRSLPHNKIFVADQHRATAFAQKYSSALPAYNPETHPKGKAKPYKLLKTGIPLANISTILRNDSEHPYLTCNYNFEKTTYPKAIVLANSGLNISNNPIRSLVVPSLVIPTTFRKPYIFAVSCKTGCASPACARKKQLNKQQLTSKTQLTRPDDDVLKATLHEQCTFSLMFQGETATKGQTVSVFACGSHCPEFYVDLTTLRLDTAVKQEAKHLLKHVANSTQIQEAIISKFQHESTSSATVITNEQLAHMKYYDKIRTLGPAVHSFVSAKKMLALLNDKNTSVCSATHVGGISVTDMNEDNWQFILFFNDAISRAKEHAKRNYNV